MPLDPRGRIVPRATPAGVDAANANFTVRDGARHALGAMADNLEAGFISYKSWADATWEPPSRVEMLLGMMQRFQHDGSWCFVGFADGAPAGHVTAGPAVDEQGPPRPGVARLTHLFLRRDSWGSGLADILYETMLGSMVERGYTSATLGTPTGAGRAAGFCAASRSAAA